MNLQVNKTIFIVCEGSGTEPNYFDSIRDLIIERGLNIKITISPLPKNEEEQVFQLRLNAKKRVLKKIAKEKEAALKNYEIAEEFRAQPIRYVREAQIGLEDGTFDEVWAVFDKNGHPKHKEAFDLAANKVNGKTVNIAFSSIAFEYWLILHFQQLWYPFLKSQCREGVEILHCGTKMHANDCNGNSCVCGYLIAQKLLPNYSKGMHNLFRVLEPHIYTAMDNASWLRNNVPIADKGKPVYELNPYISIDHLIFSLLQLPRDLTWFNKNDEVNTDDISFRTELNGNILRILVKNTNIRRRFILNPGSFLLSNSSGTLYALNDRKILDDKEVQIEFDFNSIPEYNPIFILYKIAGQKYFITDL